MSALEYGTVVSTPAGVGYVVAGPNPDHGKYTFGASAPQSPDYKVHIDGHPALSIRGIGGGTYTHEFAPADLTPRTGAHTVTLSEWLAAHGGGFTPYTLPKVRPVPRLSDKRRAALYAEFGVSESRA